MNVPFDLVQMYEQYVDKVKTPLYNQEVKKVVLSEAEVITVHAPMNY